MVQAVGMNIRYYQGVRLTSDSKVIHEKSTVMESTLIIDETNFHTLWLVEKSFL